MTSLTADCATTRVTGASRRWKLAIVTTHVIQYQDPFFRILAAEPELNLTVLFCSNAGAAVYQDEDMGTSLRWDLALLQGYSHRFLRNLSWQGTSAGFWRAVNPGLVPALARGHFDAVLFMTGWGVFTAWLGILTCNALGIPFLLYGDSSFIPTETTLRARLRARLMRRLFARTSGFMISGALNAEYYRHYGADLARFFPLPWAIDNERFEQGSRFAPGEREALRARFGFTPEQMVIVFSGKLIERKDPLLLLRAMERMKSRARVGCLFIGDGELSGALKSFAVEHEVANVKFSGFVNQTELPRLYAVADVFVLPSLDDPRATVVNEAMACGLPVIVSDRCGPACDIVVEGDNGFVVGAGDVERLADRLDFLSDNPDRRAEMGARSREIIAGWDYAAGVAGVRRALSWLRSP